MVCVNRDINKKKYSRINPAASDARLAPAAADWAPSGRDDPAWAAPGGRHWAAAECDEAAAADVAGRAHARGEAVRPRWAVHDDRRRGRRPADSTGRHRGDARWHVTETYTNSPRLQYTSQSCGIFLVSISYGFCYKFFSNFSFYTGNLIKALTCVRGCDVGT